jgi:hypothetical protein
MIMVKGKLWRRGTWKAGVVTACAAALLSLGLLPAAAQAGTRAAAPQRAEGVRVIGHKVIDGKTYKVIYVAGARPLDHNRSMQLILNPRPAKLDIRTSRATCPSSLIFVCAGQEIVGQR